MARSKHGCNCDYCVYGRGRKQELQHGGMDWETDEEELVRYVKPARSNWHHKSTRACKKSKTGEKCDFSVKVVYRSWGVYTDYVMTCSRCSKHGGVIWAKGPF